MWTLAFCIVILFNHHCVESDDHPKGHLQPLGRHRHPSGTVEERETFPTPQEMYEKYVKGSKPVIFRGILEKGMLPAYKLWTDSYLREKYGTERVDVEKGKKENRKWDLLNLTMADFLDKYSTEDIYMVNDASDKMAEEINMPSMFLCGGFQRVVQNVIMWFSSGGTKSVLHNDALDNVNCLIDGQKDFVMIDKKLKGDVEESGWIQNGQYSKVDVEKVDMYEFPKFRDLPWYDVKMRKGDCIFIPFKWYHHVDSRKGRNLAINIWVQHLTSFNASDCSTTKTDQDQFVSVAQFRKDSKRMELRDFLLGELEVLEFIDWSFFEAMKPSGQLKVELKQLFNSIDSDGDGKLTESEVVRADLNKLIKQSPSLQDMLLEDEPYGEEAGEEGVADFDEPDVIMDDYDDHVYGDVIDDDLLERQRHFMDAPKQTQSNRDEL